MGKCMDCNRVKAWSNKAKCEVQHYFDYPVMYCLCTDINELPYTEAYHKAAYLDYLCVSEQVTGNLSSNAT